MDEEQWGPDEPVRYETVYDLTFTIERVVCLSDPEQTYYQVRCPDGWIFETDPWETEPTRSDVEDVAWIYLSEIVANDPGEECPPYPEYGAIPDMYGSW